MERNWDELKKKGQLIREADDKFLEELSLEDLFTEIKKVTNLDHLQFTIKREFKSYEGCVVLSFTSQDVEKDIQGFVGLIFDEMRIDCHRGWVSHYLNGRHFRVDDLDDLEYISFDDINKIQRGFTGNVHLSYHHPGGGSNGHDFMGFEYKEGEGWNFVIDKYAK